MLEAIEARADLPGVESLRSISVTRASVVSKGAE